MRRCARRDSMYIVPCLNRPLALVSASAEPRWASKFRRMDPAREEGEEGGLLAAAAAWLESCCQEQLACNTDGLLVLELNVVDLACSQAHSLLVEALLENPGACTCRSEALMLAPQLAEPAAKAPRLPPWSFQPPSTAAGHRRRPAALPYRPRPPTS